MSYAIPDTVPERIDESVEIVLGRVVDYRAEIERRLGDALDVVHSFLTERGDEAYRHIVAATAERIIFGCSPEDAWRIAEAYDQRYNERDDLPPEVQLASDPKN